MKALLLLFTICIAPLATESLSAQESTTEDVTVYYCIRHAEKDRSNPANKNPNLTSQGKQRAQKWARVLENVSFDAVYSTDYNRTRQTAAPTAEKQGLKLKSYDPRDLYNESFQNCTKGQTVLVVGHSNTVPELISGLGGPELGLLEGHSDLFFLDLKESSDTSFLRINFKP